MIFLDDHGLPVDNTRDGGDSCVRAGILNMAKDPHAPAVENFYVRYNNFRRNIYVIPNCAGIRHPFQSPWQNPYNFTRDQLLMLMAGLKARGQTSIMRDLLDSLQRNGWKCFNLERDWPGTTKHPYPHFYFDKDNQGNDIGPRRFKFFDGPDPLTGSHVWAMSTACGYPMSGFETFWGPKMFKLDIYNHCHSNYFEENQAIAMCFLADQMNLYRGWRIDFESRLTKYWGDRGEIEYAVMMIQVVNG